MTEPRTTLPTDAQIINEANSNEFIETINEIDSFELGAMWMRSIAEKIIAEKDAEIQSILLIRGEIAKQEAQLILNEYGKNKLNKLKKQLEIAKKALMQTRVYAALCGNQTLINEMDGHMNKIKELDASK